MANMANRKAAAPLETKVQENTMQAAAPKAAPEDTPNT